MSPFFRLTLSFPPFLLLLLSSCSYTTSSLLSNKINSVLETVANEAAAAVDYLQSLSDTQPEPEDLQAVTLEDLVGAEGVVVVKYKTDTLHLHSRVVEKLRSLYSIHSGDVDREQQHFAASLYCMVRRYLTLSLESVGASFEASCPRALLSTLNHELDVCFDMFASPLNCYFRNFCSPFPDTDSAFGSTGSFFQLQAKSGSFIIHPPRTQEALDAAAVHLEALLSRLDAGALSFVVVAPDWHDPPSQSLQMMEGSAFLRAEFRAPEEKHTFISGLEHLAGSVWDQWLMVPHLGTRVFVLQTAAGAEQWPVTDAKMSVIQRSLGAADSA